VGNIRLYKDRWQAVEEIERQELNAMTPGKHWQSQTRRRSHLHCTKHSAGASVAQHPVKG
jgi:hypothetical protein